MQGLVRPIHDVGYTGFVPFPESPLYGPDQGESDENFRLSDVSYLDSTLQHDSHGKPSKPKLAKNEKSGHGILSNGRNGKVKKRSDLKQMQQNSKAATHCEIKRLLTSPLGLGALQYSGLPCLPRPEMQPPLVVQYFRELARRTQSNIANGGLNIAVMPFESCATMPLGGGSSESFGRQLSSTPPTPTGDDVTKYDSGNRKARRKNIGKSRQLRKNNLLSSPATLPDNYTALVTPPQMSKSSASSSENSPDDSSTLAPLNLSTKHKEVPEQISPNFVAMVSDCRQQGFSSSRTSSSGEHLEHSTFDCAVCEESVCQLLDGHQQRQPRSNSSSVSATEEDDVTTAKAVGSHVCDFCQVTFASAQKLKSHRRCHLKPFPCTVCSKSFTNSGKRTVLVVLGCRLDVVAKILPNFQRQMRTFVPPGSLLRLKQNRAAQRLGVNLAFVERRCQCSVTFQMCARLFLVRATCLCPKGEQNSVLSTADLSSLSQGSDKVGFDNQISNCGDKFCPKVPKLKVPHLVSDQQPL